MILDASVDKKAPYAKLMLYACSTKEVGCRQSLFYSSTLVANSEHTISNLFESYKPMTITTQGS